MAIVIDGALRSLVFQFGPDAYCNSPIEDKYLSIDSARVRLFD